MKVIKLKNGMILKEVERTIDRVANRLQVSLVWDIPFGESYQAKKAALIRETSLLIQKSKEPELWSKLKDTERDTLIKQLFSDLKVVRQAETAYQKSLEEYKAATKKREKQQALATKKWEEKSAEIRQKVETDATYTLSKKRGGGAIWPSPSIDLPEKPEEKDCYQLLSDLRLEYLTDLITKGEEESELLAFDKVIELES